MRSALLKPLLISLAVGLTAGSQAQASGWRYGFSVGYGGAGIKADAIAKDGGSAKVERSEGPLIMDVFVDRLLTDTFGLSFEHSRGVSLVPASTGASFTGLVARWYFMGPAPSMVPVSEGATVFTRRFIPFAGIAAGVAVADIKRDATDFVPNVAGSGAFTGIRLGADYQISPGQALRPQLVYSSTTFTSAFSTSATPPELTQFSLQLGWMFTY